MRIDDRYVVQEVGVNKVVLVDDSTGQEEVLLIDQPSVADFNTRMRSHDPAKPLVVGEITVPPELIFSFGLAIGYFYAHAAHG